MDFLEQTVERLSTEERTDFRQFLQKQRQNRRDLQLFELLASAKAKKPREIAASLYQPVNMNAYHSLRKRLMGQLFTFVVNKRLAADSTRASTIMGMISMGQFMLEKSADKAAAYFLSRAEQVARNSQQFDLLSNIYSIQIMKADVLRIDLDELIQKWQDNNRRYLARQKLDMASALIRKNLALARKAGTTLDPEAIIESVFRDFELQAEDVNDPGYMYRIAAMTRSAIVSSKDYYRFEPFVNRIYERLKQNRAFGKSEAHYELGFLYMISHVFYRNRKFKEAAKWLDEMEKLLPAKTFRASAYFPKYVSLRAAVASYSGRNTEAIELMKAALQNRLVHSIVAERLNMQLNLAVYYFQSSEFRKANRTIVSLGHSDRWLEERMGKEWRFKKNMIEMIIQCELGHYDIALSMLNALEKYFSAFLSHPAYQRGRVFLGFIRRLITVPETVTTTGFAEEVKESRLGLPGEQEDIQAITFFCWLKSKMLRRDYYEVLLEAMQIN